MDGRRLNDQLAAALGDDADRELARSLLNCDEPGEIAQRLRAFAKNELGAAIDELELCELSAGVVFGVRLCDGQRMVVKVFRPDTGTATVDSWIAVQRKLAADGFPCPTVLGPRRAFGASPALVMPLLDEGSYVDASAPAVRAEWAALLHRQIDSCRRFAEFPGIQSWRPPPRRLWPRPHSALFDFERTQRGAEWIDSVAADALAVLEQQREPIVLGHADWSAKHFRYLPQRPAGRRITVVYDWDSLQCGTEAEIVAGAAVTFTVTWYVPGRATLPAISDSLAFVRDYEAARGAPFGAAERQALTAAARYARAYTARCEHSAGGRGAQPTLRDVVDDFRL